MPSISDQCPVTNEPAQQAQMSTGDFAEFTCPTCGRFRVSQWAVQQLSDMPQALANDALAKAKKRAEIDGDEVPVIRSFDLVLS
jgi:hypothetical protein